MYNILVSFKKKVLEPLAEKTRTSCTCVSRDTGK